MFTSDLERIHAVNRLNIAFFSSLAAQHGEESAGVGWSTRSQLARFEVLIKIGNLSGMKVLDVGCGYGDYFRFLTNKQISVDYTGFDITPAMIQIAKKKYPEVADRFRLFDILTQETSEKFDYVIANGPLNVEFGDNLAVMVRLIEEMYQLCEIGLGITMTSAMTRRPTPGTHYFAPNEVVGLVGQFCQNFVLDHSYLPHDFALFCYKSSVYR